MIIDHQIIGKFTYHIKFVSHQENWKCLLIDRMFLHGHRFHLAPMGGLLHRTGNKGVVENGLLPNGRHFYAVHFSKIYYNCNMKAFTKSVSTITNLKFKSLEILLSF